tara:strand:- start:1935 stop:2657 length:723 start_codon:yes stop_codon:yes gene_type:complete
MRHAIFGDIHSNLEAFDAVIKDARTEEVEGFVCVGDVVGYGAEPSACIDRVQELSCHIVRGNHDHYCCHTDALNDMNPAAANVVRWTRDRLTAAHLEFLRRMRMVRSLDGFTIVHSTLDEPGKWGYVFEEMEAEASFTYQTTPVCFHGHTHVPCVYENEHGVRKGSYHKIKVASGKQYFINVGSVGQPRDGDSRAAYVLYDSKAKELELRRVVYDITGAQRKILDAGLPPGLAHRLALGK